MEAFDVNAVDDAVTAVSLKTNGGAVTLKRVRGGWSAVVSLGDGARRTERVASTPSGALDALARAV